MFRCDVDLIDADGNGSMAIACGRFQLPLWRSFPWAPYVPVAIRRWKAPPLLCTRSPRVPAILEAAVRIAMLADDRICSFRRSARGCELDAARNLAREGKIENLLPALVWSASL
mmetsp:Transcript_6377/g.39790  ORF Transcript_6377/g.39790 Transcript_6377/m.39790 type:complete len:114 (+) Transcript_6377:1692-2033(+)